MHPAFSYTLEQLYHPMVSVIQVDQLRDSGKGHEITLREIIDN